MAYRFLVVLCILTATKALAQSDTTIIALDSTAAAKDSLSKFDRFNQKAEALFKILPVPLYSYSTEAGNIFGLAKFNLFHLSKNDTVSKPSKLSEVATFSSKGRVNISVSTELVFNKNKNIILAYINYKKTTRIHIWYWQRCI